MKLSKSKTAPSVELLDALMESYVTWREESAAVNASYHCWKLATLDERGAAFGDYLSALDREEDAALQYRRLVERVGAAAPGREATPPRIATA